MSAHTLTYCLTLWRISVHTTTRDLHREWKDIVSYNNRCRLTGQMSFHTTTDVVSRQSRLLFLNQALYFCLFSLLRHSFMGSGKQSSQPSTFT